MASIFREISDTTQAIASIGSTDRKNERDGHEEETFQQGTVLQTGNLNADDEGYSKIPPAGAAWL